MAYVEVVFDLVYLVGVVILSGLILQKGIQKESKAVITFGVMGLLLGFGDAFHLVPRILGHLAGDFARYDLYLGLGKLITGVTMTIFYWLIYRYYILVTGCENQMVTYSLLALIFTRFVLLALPGNGWIENESSLFYGILRNIPFTMIGGIIVVLFYQVKDKVYKKQFHNMGFWIIVSFVCYAIVVLGSGTYAFLGAFMMPKTVAYVLIMITGYKAIDDVS